MAGITLEQAEAKLAEYLAAETAVLAGQSVSVEGRSLALADLDSIQRGIEVWDSRVKAITTAASGPAVRSRSIRPGF